MKLKHTLITTLFVLTSVTAFADNRERNSAETDKNEAVQNEIKAGKYEPSNSGKNIRDRNKNSLTADDQSNTASDTELVAKVRSSLMKDDNLSTLAQNVKIIAQSGVLTLRGPVKSAEESKNIETKAVQIAGLNNVKNELEVDMKR